MLKVIVGLGTKNRGDEIIDTCHYFTEGNAEGRGLRIRLKILETVVEVGEGVDGVHEARVLGRRAAPPSRRWRVFGRWGWCRRWVEFLGLSSIWRLPFRILNSEWDGQG